MAHFGRTKHMVHISAAVLGDGDDALSPAEVEATAAALQPGRHQSCSSCCEAGSSWLDMAVVAVCGLLDDQLPSLPCEPASLLLAAESTLSSERDTDRLPSSPALSIRWTSMVVSCSEPFFVEERLALLRRCTRLRFFCGGCRSTRSGSQPKRCCQHAAQ